MFHAADHFLPHIATLGEINAIEQVHGDVVGESLVGGKIIALMQYAGCDTGQVIGTIIVDPAGGIGKRRDGLPAQLHRAAPVRQKSGGRVGRITHAMAFAQILDFDLGAQAIHAHPLEEVVGHGLVRVEPDGAIRPGGHAFGQNLALGRKQRPPTGEAIILLWHNAGQHIIEQAMGLGAGKAEDGPIGAKGDGHGLPRRTLLRMSGPGIRTHRWQTWRSTTRFSRTPPWSIMMARAWRILRSVRAGSSPWAASWAALRRLWIARASISCRA